MSTSQRALQQSWVAEDILKQAEALCRSRLFEAVKEAGILHLSGLIAAKRAQATAALAFLTRAVVLDPQNQAYLIDLAEALAAAGRGAEAIGACLRAIILLPNSPVSYRSLGQILAKLGHFVAARAAFEYVLRLAPGHASTHGDLGDVLRALGSDGQALQCYERNLQLDPHDVEARARLGRLHLERGESELALTHFKAGLVLQPDREDMHTGIGRALMRLGEFEQAAVAFRKGVDLGSSHACRHLITVLEWLGKSDEIAGAWCWFGHSLLASYPGEARIAFDQTLTRTPNCLRALNGLGSAYLQLCEPHKAKAAYQSAIRAQPHDTRAHVGLGIALHQCGDLVKGWQELSWINRDFNHERFEQPIWDGDSLSGRTILVWSDRFLGDTIQNLRYVGQVKARGGRVVIECDPILVPLVERLTDADRVVVRDSPLPEFDVHAPIGDLPRIFHTCRSTIPADVPYLTVDEVLTKRWSETLGRPGQTRVGLVWGGESSRVNAHVRFASLAAFRPFAGTSNTRYISLQLGRQVAELLAPPAGLHIEQFLNQSTTIDDTAALVLNLDLVITVDTMIAHLAGALGKPVWTLVPFAVDWRWHADGDRSPWYPTMRLFRQKYPGDWFELLMRVRTALDEHNASRLAQTISY